MRLKTSFKSLKLRKAGLFFTQLHFIDKITIACSKNFQSNDSRVILFLYNKNYGALKNYYSNSITKLIINV